LVAPISSTRRLPDPGSHPSICTSISVLSRRDASCSPSALRADISESISSTKMTDGCSAPATAKSVRTFFWFWFCYVEVRVGGW
jgi:hypothetical protein